MGVVGSGYWAVSTHLPAALASDFTLTGVWGRDAEKASVAGRAVGVTGFSDYDEFLREVDVVTLAVPPTVQTELALRAIEQGKHVMLEKPLGLSPEEAAAIVASVQRARVASSVNLTARFQPEIATWMKERGEEHWDGATLRWISDDLIAPGSPWAPSTWRQEHGALWDLGPHALSFLTLTLGEIAEIRAQRHPEAVTELRTVHERGAEATVMLGQHSTARESVTQLSRGREVSTPPLATTDGRQALTLGLNRLAERAATGSQDVSEIEQALRITQHLGAAQRHLDAGV